MTGNGQAAEAPIQNKRKVGILQREGNLVKLTDLDAAAYLFMRKLALSQAVHLHRGYFEFTFFDPEHRADDLCLEYVGSICSDYADAVARLKRVIHGFRGRMQTGEETAGLEPSLAVFSLQGRSQ